MGLNCSAVSSIGPVLRAARTIRPRLEGQFVLVSVANEPVTGSFGFCLTETISELDASKKSVQY